MKTFKKPESVTPKELTASLEGIGDDEFVVYTGGVYAGRRRSGRLNSLRTITEVRKPVALKELIRRSAKKGFRAGFVLNGLGLHAQAKPSVYIRLERGTKGEYRNVTLLVNPDTNFVPKGVITPKGVLPGSVIIAAKKKRSTPKEVSVTTPKEIEATTPEAITTS